LGVPARLIQRWQCLLLLIILWKYSLIVMHFLIK
jgi:hypothetical protein